MMGDRRVLAASVAVTLLAVGLGWIVVYLYALDPLLCYGYERLTALFRDPFTAEWWRNAISLGFDLLVVAVAVVGTWWVAATLVREAQRAGLWWRYLRSDEVFRDVWVERLTLWQRLQHAWLMVTFLVCAVTGFASLQLPPGSLRTSLLTVHVYSGLAMGVLVLVHAAQYGVELVLAKAAGRRLREEFPMLELFSRKFLIDLYRALTLKLYSPGKYDPEQLFEYWGVYWGILVLGVPGVIMVLEGVQALNGIPYLMHVKEAVLATSFIVMVHLAYTHFRPSVFPLDPTFITGRMPLRRVVEEHPEWARRLMSTGRTGVRVEAKSLPRS